LSLAIINLKISAKGGPASGWKNQISPACRQAGTSKTHIKTQITPLFAIRLSLVALFLAM